MATTWKKDYLRYKEFFLNIVRIYNTRPTLKIYLELVLSLTTILIFSIFAIRPTVLTIIELTKEISDKEEKIVIMEEKLKNLNLASNLLENESERLPLILQSIPETSNLEKTVPQIEKLIGSNNLTLVNFSVTDTVLKGKDKTNRVIFTLSVTGNYKDVFSFLTSIENFRRPIDFKSVTLNESLSENGKKIILIITGELPFLVNL